MSRRYETVYIFDSSLDEPAITEKLNRFHALLTKDGKGTLSNVSHWGKRTMAYKVKKKDTGYYVVAEFSAAGDLLPGTCASRPRRSSRNRWWLPPSLPKKKSWKRRKRETSRQNLSGMRIRRARARLQG